MYYDRDGRVISAGDIISIAGDEPELVYSCISSYGNPDLGVNASNEDYLALHPEAVRKYYSLNNFYMSDIALVSKG